MLEILKREKEYPMKTAIHAILFVIISLAILSSCASPKPTPPVAQPSPATPSSTPQTEKPTAASIEKTFDELAEIKVDRRKVDEEHVKNVITMRQNQLHNLYKLAVVSTPMQGTLEITLYINGSGTLDNSMVKVDSGNFTPDFLAAVKNEMVNWRFLVREPLTFAFLIKFPKA